MDNAKCNALKADLASQPEPRTVPIERFFDGNDDLGSIGCNLLAHPGMDAFREALTGLLRRPDVKGVYAQIAEVGTAADLAISPSVVARHGAPALALWWD